MNQIVCVFFISIMALLLIIIPASIFIYLVHRLIVDLDKNKRDIINIISISIFIPVINLIYFLTAFILSNSVLGIISGLIGVLWLFIFLPIIFCVIIVIPKNKIKKKKQVLITIILTLIIGWTLAILSSVLVDKIRLKQTYDGLEQYKMTIEYLNNYKKKHYKYPIILSKKEVCSKNLPYFNYKTYNNQNNFVLNVSDSEKFYTYYSYSPNIKIKKRIKLNNNRYIEKSQRMGDWIKFELDD